MLKTWSHGYFRRLGTDLGKDSDEHGTHLHSDKLLALKDGPNTSVNRKLEHKRLPSPFPCLSRSLEAALIRGVQLQLRLGL